MRLPLPDPSDLVDALLDLADVAVGRMKSIAADADEVVVSVPPLVGRATGLVDADGARRGSARRPLLELVEDLHRMAAELPGTGIACRGRDPDATSAPGAAPTPAAGSPRTGPRSPPG